MQMVPVLICVTMVAFFVVNALPGNILYTILGPAYTPHAATVLSKELGLNHPIFLRYLDWLGNAVQGNLGTSLISHERVATALWAAAPPTVELVIVSQVLAIFLAVTLAAFSVLSPTPWVDRLATGFALTGNSIPAFVTGLLLLIVFAAHLHIASSVGWIAPHSGGWPANLRAILLPSIILAISIFPSYMRVLRREMYDQLDNEEYVILARMKGISATRLILRHVARNSALGIITLIGLSTSFLIGGAVIIEQIFQIPGIGLLTLSAITSSDAPMVEGCIVVIGSAIVLLNLLADLTYAVFDPRVRLRG